MNGKRSKVIRELSYLMMPAANLATRLKPVVNTGRKRGVTLAWEQKTQRYIYQWMKKNFKQYNIPKMTHDVEWFNMIKEQLRDNDNSEVKELNSL